jgi:carbamate kinase
MGPKVEAACGFARATGREAVIGALTDITDIVGGAAGTRVRMRASR